MFRDITLGQYYNADSLLHRLDPRVKLLATMVFLISLFLPKSPISLLLATVFLFGVIALSKVPVSMYIRGIKPLLIIIVMSGLMNLFFTAGEVIFSFGPLQITKEGMIMAFYLMIRLIYLIIGSSVMTFTTTPNQLTAGIEKGLHILTKIRVPVHEFAMMMSIALRFIPILTEELDKIMKAQMARGVDFDEGNVLTRVRKLIPILVPLFISSLRRASELGLAMDARCYHGGEGRSKYHPLQYVRRDYLAYLLLLLYFLCMIAASFLWRMLG